MASAVKLDASGVVENVIVVDDYLPDGYQRVTFPVSIGQTLDDAQHEHAASTARAQRDRLLADTDWIVTKAIEQNAQDGLGVQIPVVWLDYRQALRDIPQQAGFPDNVTWPTQPA